jgi:hypothetical protein
VEGAVGGGEGASAAPAAEQRQQPQQPQQPQQQQQQQQQHANSPMVLPSRCTEQCTTHARCSEKVETRAICGGMRWSYTRMPPSPLPVTMSPAAAPATGLSGELPALLGKAGGEPMPVERKLALDCAAASDVTHASARVGILVLMRSCTMSHTNSELELPPATSVPSCWSHMATRPEPRRLGVRLGTAENAVTRLRGNRAERRVERCGRVSSWQARASQGRARQSMAAAAA